MDTAVEWRDCDRFPGYRVSSAGELQTCWRSKGNAGRVQTDCWRVVPCSVGNHGYRRFRAIDRTGQRIDGLVHVVVCETFHGPRPSPEMMARHLNDVRTDNRADNLAWGTHHENMADAERNGRRRKGEKVAGAILTAGEVVQIRQLIEQRVTYKVIGFRFGVSWITIRNIAQRKTWKHVEAVT